jgi:hypothetical protein
VRHDDDAVIALFVGGSRGAVGHGRTRRCVVKYPVKLTSSSPIRSSTATVRRQRREIPTVQTPQQHRRR